jgi:uncharacterized protein YkwD
MLIASKRLTNPLLAALLLAGALVATSLLGHPKVDSAQASGCPDSGSSPYEVGTKRARAAVTCLINQARHRHGRSSLKARTALRSAAARHSRYMEAHHCFSHQCRGEAPLARRVQKAGYLSCRCTWGVGEDLHWGKRSKGTPRSVVRGWLNSPAHRAAMLSRQYNHVGVGVVAGGITSSHAKAGVYTADFGFKR